MGEAIGSMLGFAVGVAVSPLPIVAIILLLASARGGTNGMLFGLGWVVGLAALGAVILLLAEPADASTDSGPAAWAGWLKIVLGALLILFAARQWRARPDPGVEPAPPKWMAKLDTLTPAAAFGLGALLATVNPKNGVLTIAAAAAIAGTGADTADQAVALALFVLIGSLGMAAPIVVYRFGGQHAAATLESWRAWFVAHNAAIMAVLFLLLGAKLLGDGIVILA